VTVRVCHAGTCFAELDGAFVTVASVVCEDREAIGLTGAAGSEGAILTMLLVVVDEGPAEVNGISVGIDRVLFEINERVTPEDVIFV
jgi:hypothetical protein